MLTETSRTQKNNCKILWDAPYAGKAIEKGVHQRTEGRGDEGYHSLSTEFLCGI